MVHYCFTNIKPPLFLWTDQGSLAHLHMYKVNPRAANAQLFQREVQKRHQDGSIHLGLSLIIAENFVVDHNLPH